MSLIARQESLVKESLFQFVSKHIPDADLSVIDDIVLSYVISILEEAKQDPCFHVEAFIEMMSAYLPGFSCIETALVCSWIFDLEAELSHSDSSDSVDGNDLATSGDMSLSMQSLSDMLPVVNNKARCDSGSESSQEGKCQVWLYGEGEGGAVLEQCRMLHEMFPRSSAVEIKHCVSIGGGDMERAAQTLLHRRDNGQSLLGGSTLAAINRHRQIDDAELKNRIIARYSYVDKNAEAKEHKPLAPKIEPKKMVRYRDNKIVSLKGERYTEVPKSGADDDQIKKPKRQHCP